MVNEQYSKLIGDIAAYIIENIGNDDREGLLYLAGDELSLEIALYRVYDHHVDYVRTQSDLTRAACDLWYLPEPAKRWSVMTCSIVGGRFAAEFLYATDLLPNEDAFQALERIVTERFQDKEIRYPPIDRGQGGIGFDL